MKIKSATVHATSAMIALVPVGLATALSLMGDATLYAVLPTHYADAGIALGSVGIVLSVNRFIRLLSNGPTGWLFDRIPNRRALFLASLWLGVISTILYAACDGIVPLFLARALWGISWSGIWIGGNAIVLQLAPDNERGHWVGIFQVWFFFGSAFASFFGGAMTDGFGYRQALMIGAGISAISTLAATVGLARQHVQSRAGVIRASHAHESFWESIRTISPAMWANATAHGLNRLASAGVIVATLGLAVQASLGSQIQFGIWTIGVASLTGAFLSARTLLSLISSPIAGNLSDRAGGRWGLLTVSLGALAAGMGLLAISNAVALIVGSVIGALASGSIQTLSTALVGDLAGNTQGKNLGIFYTMGDLGSGIGAIVPYALLTITGLPTIYLACALLLVVSAGWMMQLGRSTTHQLENQN